MKFTNNETNLFEPDFINLLSNILIQKNLTNVTELKYNTKYTVNYITNIIIDISTKKNTKFTLHPGLIDYFKVSLYSSFTKQFIKTLIKQQIINPINDSFLNTYIIIGYDIPITVNELTVIC